LGGAYRLRGIGDKYIQHSGRKPLQMRQFGELEVEGRIIIKRMLVKQNVKVETGLKFLT
jgi:hypothetical protein